MELLLKAAFRSDVCRAYLVRWAPDEREREMPVTAKLSKQFYDRLGEVVANELVDWFNQVDAAYKTDLREMNELNFARFDAKLEQRVAELGARLDGKIEQRVAELGARLDSKIERTAADLRVAMEKGFKDQTRFLFGAWAALVAALLGAIIPLWFR